MSHVDNEVVVECEKIKGVDEELTKKINDSNTEKEGAEKKRTEELKVVAQIELDLRDMKDKSLSEKRANDEDARDLRSVRIENERSKFELTEISQVHQAKSKEEEILKSIMDREKRLSNKKQGRATQFANEFTRDEWLQREFDVLSSYFYQIKNRTVICRDLETATKVARGNGLDCITFYGDQVARKGGMTGGFYDSRRSRLKFVKIIRDNETAIEKKTAHLENIRLFIPPTPVMVLGAHGMAAGDMRARAKGKGTSMDSKSKCKGKAMLAKGKTKDSYFTMALSFT